MKARLFGNKITKVLQGRTLKRGVATLEILIAFAILMLSMSAVIVVVFSNQNISADTQTNREAIYKAKALIEEARANSYEDFNAVASLGPVQDDIYQKSLTVTSLSADTKKVTSSVSWSLLGRNLAVSFTTLLTNPSVGNSCSAVVEGDWSAPQIYGYADFPSSTGAVGVDVESGKAYTVSDPNSSGADDFYVVDVSSASPGAGSMPILGRFSTGYGLTDVHVAGNYAFVSAHSAAAQLAIVDISNPTALSSASIRAKRDVVPTSDTAYGKTLYYTNKRVYLGLTNSIGREFRIFDVSDPEDPVELGAGFEVGATVNNILVKNNIAYLATTGNDEVIALDVSDLNNITKVSVYSSPTLTAQGLSLGGGVLYLGRIGGNGNPKLLAFNPSSLLSPVWSMNMIKQSGAYTIVVRSNYLFMTTADPNDGLQIWDVENASASVAPTRVDTSPLNIQQTATAGTDCYGNYLYVAQRSQRALQVVGPNSN